MIPKKTADISLAIDNLGWRPLIDLETGLQKTMRLF